jgi:propanol-preferring alcohol dehydrogenase
MAIIPAPVGALVPKALHGVVRGGIVVAAVSTRATCRAPYDLLWRARLCSVANLTRQDAGEFISLAQRIPVRTTVVAYPMEDANAALAALRHGSLTGAAVLTMT